MLKPDISRELRETCVQQHRCLSFLSHETSVTWTSRPGMSNPVGPRAGGLRDIWESTELMQ